MGIYLSSPKTEKVSEDGENDQIKYGVSNMQGWRASMEDAHAVVPNFDNGTSFFGVYDGHGGKVVSKFCAKFLHQVVKAENHRKGDLCESLQAAFIRMDEMMCGERGWRELAILGDKQNKITGLLDGIMWSPRSGANRSDTREDDWASEQGAHEDFANHTSLIRLELCGCKELRGLPESIGLLTELKYLDLSNCCSLVQLPDTIANLSSLEVLFLSNCHSIRVLPDLFENLRVLKKIKLDGMPLKTLPKSFRWLSCLEKLSLHCCHELRSLPQPVGELNCLRYLDIHGCSSLQTLPDSIYEIKSLCRLDMAGSKRISLGAELGDLVCMERLNLSNCAAIRSLPIAIGQLNCLRHLNLNHCTSLFRLPEELGNLVHLEELLLNECYNLCELPHSTGKLSFLRTLEMEENYSLSVLPASFSKLTSLKCLKAGGCPLPQQIGEFSSLEILHLKSYKISSLPPTFSTLPRLSKLYLHHCTEFVELPHLPKELIEVRVQDCLGLKKISNMSHMKRLKLLRIHNCTELVELPDFGSLQSLQELSVSECRNVKRIQGVEGLKSLRRLHVTGCRLVSSGSSILKPRQLIKETRCLELFSFSANGVPECLEKKMETDGDDFLYVTLDSDEQCSGVILCFMVRFKSGINSVDIELSTLRNGMEIFNTKLVNHSKNVEGDQIFVHILRKNHPMVMMAQSGDVVRAKADKDEERILIRSGGMQFFSEGEDGKREDLILESLGKGLTVLMEDYNENIAFEDE